MEGARCASALRELDDLWSEGNRCIPGAGKARFATGRVVRSFCENNAEYHAEREQEQGTDRN